MIAQLYEALGRGEESIVSEVGAGSFLDPRVGRGSPAQGGRREQWLAVEAERLRYRMPRIDVAIFNLPAADRLGNLYAGGAAMVGDSREIAQAAKRNGGLVIANVGLLVDERRDDVFLPADLVDAIVCHSDTEQTLGFFHRDPWRLVLPHGEGDIGDGLDHARLIRRLGAVSGGFPRRTPVEDAVARLAARTLTSELEGGAHVAIGTGLPEDAAYAVYESGHAGDFTFLLESGVVGGVPALGPYFGAAFRPREIMSTAELFARCRRHLDAACLGALEVDGDGNVNVSRRGRGVLRYVGPGGFLDFVAAARTIVFVLGWMRGGEMRIEDAAIRIVRRGRPKFVRRIGELTFDASRALREGKKLLYVTPVGVFRRTSRGLELARVMPGIDVRRDILEFAQFPIALPASGDVPVIDRSGE